MGTTKPDAQTDYQHLAKPHEGESNASVVQAEIQTAHKYFQDNNDPAGYNNYIRTLEGYAKGSSGNDPKENQLLGEIQFYDSRALGTDVNGQSDDHQAYGFLNLQHHASDRENYLHRLGYNSGDSGKDYEDFKRDHGSQGLSSAPSTQLVDAHNSIQRFADGSSRGIHTDENGNVVAINETDANGFSRKLVLDPQSGRWTMGSTVGSGEAAVPGTTAIDYTYNKDSKNASWTHSESATPTSPFLNPGDPVPSSGPNGRDRALEIGGDTLIGAGTGAAVGSVVPVLGTATGAVIGGAVGLTKGLIDWANS